MHSMPICMACTHFREKRPDAQADDPQTCDAYPKGIPQEIFPEGFDHRKPFRGDNGIRFELKEGAELPPEYE